MSTARHQEYDPIWELECHTFKIGRTKHHAYCIACRKDISVTSGGKKVLKHHGKQTGHQKAVKCNETTSIGKEIQLNIARIKKFAEGNC